MELSCQSTFLVPGLQVHGICRSSGVPSDALATTQKKSTAMSDVVRFGSLAMAKFFAIKVAADGLVTGISTATACAAASTGIAHLLSGEHQLRDVEADRTRGGKHQHRETDHDRGDPTLRAIRPTSFLHLSHVDSILIWLVETMVLWPGNPRMPGVIHTYV